MIRSGSLAIVKMKSANAGPKAMNEHPKNSMVVILAEYSSQVRKTSPSEKYLPHYLNIKIVSTWIGIHIIKIRQSQDTIWSYIMGSPVFQNK